MIPTRPTPSSPATCSDETALKRIAARDPRLAMEMVVRRYRDRLFQHAYYIVKDPQEAGDVVQEVFIKALRETRFFQEDFKMKAWLFRVTSNACYNIVRDRKRRGGILEAMPTEHTSRAAQVELVGSGERREEVLAVMDGLSADHREILILRYYDDLSYAEIAEVLDVKLGTVMSRLSRARTHLGELLGAEHPMVQEMYAPQEA